MIKNRQKINKFCTIVIMMMKIINKIASLITRTISTIWKIIWNVDKYITPLQEYVYAISNTAPNVLFWVIPELTH